MTNFLSKHQSILNLLQDGEWHETQELIISISRLNLATTLFALRRKGYEIQSKENGRGSKLYRLRSF